MARTSQAELNEAFEHLSPGGEVLMPLDNYGFSPGFGWLNDRCGFPGSSNSSEVNPDALVFSF